MTVDYSRFAEAYGAGFADRLRLVALPSCAVADPVPQGCRPTPEGPGGAQRPRRGYAHRRRGRGRRRRVRGRIGGGRRRGFVHRDPAVDQRVAGRSRRAPASSATRTRSSVPAPAGGSAPSVALGYSSGAIDGLTMGSNTQAGPSGPGLVGLRRTRSSSGATSPASTPTPATTDLCWKSDNATISLAGISGPLIPANADVHPVAGQSDPGWRVERLTGAPYTTIHQQQYWKVTGPDGTQYCFGSGHMPGQQTNSILGVPVWPTTPASRAGRRPTQAGVCQQGWRWYLDRVVDPDGNVTSYVYEREENWYAGRSALGGNVGNARYHRGRDAQGDLLRRPGLERRPVRRRTWSSAWSGAAASWSPNCPEPAKNSTGFPDVPTDLICAQNQACTVYAPVVLQRPAVRLGPDRGEGRHRLEATSRSTTCYHRFDDEHLRRGRRSSSSTRSVYAAIAFDKLNAYPPTVFAYTWKNNRVDHDGIVSRAMRHNRLTKVTNPFGGTTTVTYGQNERVPAELPGRPVSPLGSERARLLPAVGQGRHVHRHRRVQQVSGDEGRRVGRAGRRPT